MKLMASFLCVYVCARAYVMSVCVRCCINKIPVSGRTFNTRPTSVNRRTITLNNVMCSYCENIRERLRYDVMARLFTFTTETELQLTCATNVCRSKYRLFAANKIIVTLGATVTKYKQKMKYYYYKMATRAVQCDSYTRSTRGGGTPYTEVYMYVPRKCPCFWPFSLCPKKKCKFSLFVPQLNLIIFSFMEEEISQ